jgi:hypothetical protein
MATFDYGTSTPVDPHADYEWYGRHTFYDVSDVTFGYLVDITNPPEAKRAVNAISVKNFVDGEFAKLLGESADVTFKGIVGFTNSERVFFQKSPFIAEPISLWSINDLATHSDQVELSTPATVGDVKDYVDQNIEFSVAYTLGQISLGVNEAMQSQLPEALELALGNSLDVRFNSYAANVLYPEMDTRIDAALSFVGDPSILITNEINAQLPTAVENYNTINLLPTLDARDLAITEAYTLAIDQALGSVSSGASTWTQEQIEQFASAIVANDTPALITAQLNTTLPPAVTVEVTRQLDDRLVNEINTGLSLILPTAVEEEVAGYLNASLSSIVTNSVEANLADNLGSAISRALDVRLDDAIQANLDENLTGMVQNTLDATLPNQIDAALSSVLTSDNLWSLVENQSLTVIQNEIGLTVPALIDQQIESSLDPLLAAALAAQLGNALAPELDQALTTLLPEMVQTQVFTNLEIALADGGMITSAIDTSVFVGVEQYMTNVIEPDLDNRIINQFNLIAPDLIEQSVNTILESNLNSVVQLEVQNALQPELDQLTSITVPNIVGLQLTEKLPTLVEDELFARFGEARMPINRRFEMLQESALWVIEHNMGTVKFMERLYNSEGKTMFANVEVVNETSFVVRLTQAMKGWVDVEFFV